MPLTPLTEADPELMLPWRNAPAVGQAMYSHHEISLDSNAPGSRWLKLASGSASSLGAATAIA